MNPALYHDPDWPRASAWLDAAKPGEANLVVADVPFNASISPGSSHLAPKAIRSALARVSTYDISRGTDASATGVVDGGNLDPECAGPADGFELIVERAAALASAGVLLLLGGDNSVTRVGVHALARQFGLQRIGIVTLDAHLDVRSTHGGLHNGNPIRALIEDGVPGSNITQIGLAPFANSAANAQFALQSGVVLHNIEDCHRSNPADFVSAALERLRERVDAIYLDIDLDVLDLAFAPGCPGARPGGLLPTQLLGAVRAAAENPMVVAADIVELDPARDVNGQTALAAALVVMTVACGIQRR